MSFIKQTRRARGDLRRRVNAAALFRGRGGLAFRGCAFSYIKLATDHGLHYNHHNAPQHHSTSASAFHITHSTMKLVLVAFLVCVFATLARCQFGFGFDGGLDAPFQPRARDPRQNRGPVVFPQAPDNGETSGVIVGASGYGFVPPNDAGRQYQGFFGPFF